MNIFRPLRLIAAMLFLADFALAQTWIQTSAPTNNWRAVACSADGTKLIAVNFIDGAPQMVDTNPIYVSTNSGTTWTPTGPLTYQFDPNYNLTWDFLACSADGNKLEVTSAGALLPLSFTTNSGATWSFGGPMSWDSYAGGWAGICSSADGDKIFAVDGLFYASFDSGTTWTNPPSPMDLACIASSADGTKLIAGTEISYDGLYISTNAGASWTPSGPSNEIWGAVASSADGSKLVAAVYASSVLNNDGTDVYIGGPIYTSADSGVTWTPTAAPMTNWQSVASSADGTRLVAAVNGGPIYTSTNSGMTWGPAYVPSTNWQCVAMSADGNTMMATVQWGGVWVAQSTPSPQLNLTPSPTNIVLAWTVPSTNFGLQQSSDLVSWTDVTNSPVLNLTNLQDQVILPPCSRNSFYRLKTP